MKFGLRIWIAASAVVGFLTGWVVVAHNAPTAASTATQPAASAPALTSPFGSSNASGNTGSSQVQGVLSSPAQTFSRTPRLRTGGS